MLQGAAGVAPPMGERGHSDHRAEARRPGHTGHRVRGDRALGAGGQRGAAAQGHQGMTAPEDGTS